MRHGDACKPRLSEGGLGKRTQWLATILGFTMVVIAAGPRAAAGDWSWFAGMDYSTGKYGAQQTTNIGYFPFIARYAAESWIIKLTIPYVQMSGPGGIIIGNGDVVPPPNNGETAITHATGLGDIVATATYNFYENVNHGLLLDATTKVKFPTADAAEGLGTGKADFSLQGDLTRQDGNWTVFGSLGYRWMGDTAEVAFKNPWFGSAGMSYRVNRQSQWGALYDVREPVTEGGGWGSELMVFAHYHLTPMYTLQGYLVQGFADGSPDHAIGFMVSSHF